MFFENSTNMRCNELAPRQLAAVNPIIAITHECTDMPSRRALQPYMMEIQLVKRRSIWLSSLMFENPYQWIARSQQRSLF